MAVTTIHSLAEQILRRLAGGLIPLATSPSFGEVKKAIGQVINQLLKVDYYTFNAAQNSLDVERIPNGTVMALYEDVAVESWNGVSRCDLPIKPIKMPRNMGVWAVYPKWNCDDNIDLNNEFIPLQMGHGGRLKSQNLISGLLGQIGYEVFGNHVVFTKDLTKIKPTVKVCFRLVIMDIDQYDDYTALPLLPEHEMEVIEKVVALYAEQPTPDKLVDPSQSESVGIPINQQRLS